MITLSIGAMDYFDESSNKFVAKGGTLVRFEHSLLSVSKWESKYRKPFLVKEQKSNQETMDYFLFMALDPFDPRELTNDNIQALADYLNEEPQTATRVTPTPDKHGRKIVLTSEVIYAYMAMGGVPFEAELWNINRLLKLIEVINEFNKPEQKMSKAKTIQQNKQLNEARKRKYKTKG